MVPGTEIGKRGTWYPNWKEGCQVRQYTFMVPDTKSVKVVSGTVRREEGTRYSDCGKWYLTPERGKPIPDTMKPDPDLDRIIK